MCITETRDDLLRNSGGGLVNTIAKADRIYKDVRQTNDATVDSRLLVNVSDLAYRKTNQLVLGDTSTGVDVDEFLSKCISFMRRGGPPGADEDAPTSTARRRRTRDRADSDDDEEPDMIGERLDWEALGRLACFTHNARPPVPSFLLGPLSVQKKQRTQTQRRARQARDNAGQEARPEALTNSDLQQSDENSLTAICTRIGNQLTKHVMNAERALQRAGFQSMEDLKSERGRTTLRKCRVSTTGGPSLFDFVVNPQSFGQTVENMFYVSFLIKEGALGVEHDDDGLPTLGNTTETHACTCATAY